MKRDATQTGLLLLIVDQAFDHASWHGPNLRGSIRGVSVREASFRPAPNRHNIWEHIVHAAYWKYVVRRRLTGEKRGSFPEKGSNWIPRPGNGVADDETALAADIAMLMEMHSSLHRVIADLPTKRLGVNLGRGKMTALRLITGIAAHDVYHAGQIGLLKRLARTSRNQPS